MIIAISIIGGMTLLNLLLWLYTLKNFSEKMGLLSHVAVAYLNDKEKVETNEKLEKASESRIVKVTDQGFMARRPR